MFSKELCNGNHPKSSLALRVDAVKIAASPARLGANS